MVFYSKVHGADDDYEPLRLAGSHSHEMILASGPLGTINITHSGSSSMHSFHSRPSHSTFLLVMSMSKAAIGTSTLFLPFCFAQLGLLGGTLAAFIAMLLSSWSMEMLCRAVNLSGTTDLIEAIKIHRNPDRGTRCFFTLCIFVMATTPVIVCLRLTAQYIQGFLPPSVVMSRMRMEALCSILIFLPISFARDHKRLTRLAFIGMIAMLYLLFLAFYNLKGSEMPSKYVLFNTKSSMTEIISAFVTIIFSFSTHQPLPAILSTMDCRNPRIIKYSTILTFLYYSILALCFNLALNPQAPAPPTAADDVLSHKESLPFILGRMFVCIANLVSFPLLIQPLRSFIPSPYTGFIAIVVSLLISAGLQSTGRVFELLGSLCGAPVFLILPAYLDHKTTYGGNVKRIILILTGTLLFLNGLINLF